MQPIVLIPFASEVHGKEYYVAVLDVIKRYIARHGIDVHGSIVTDVEEAEKVGRKYSEFLPIALVLTGGTSKFIESFVDGGNHERLVLLAHAEHNSLASAISSKNKVERKGVASLVYHCSDINSITCISTIDRMSKVVKAVSNIIGSRIGVIVDRGVKDEIEETFESKFKAKIIIKSIDEVLKEMEVMNSNSVVEAVEKIAKMLNIEPSVQHLDRIARLYLVLRRFVEDEKLTAVTIDCFPFIMKAGVTPCIPIAILNAEEVVAGCEADLPSLIGLMLARFITGKSGWIANTVDAQSNRFYLAHCTIALDIVKSSRVLTHFETERPYAIQGEYIDKTVTMLSIDRDFTMALMGLGKVVASGNLGLSACRTQMLVELDYSIELLPNIAPNNHHIIMLGDNRKELIEALYLLGIDTAEYKDVVI